MTVHENFTWEGEHEFRISGTELHEDTLRIANNYAKSEGTLKLVLPTLCITYADMKFQNDIGGVQEKYPKSAAYGPDYFDPPVVINGVDEIERLTYIRGADQVEIDPETTVIRFPSWKELVIPRLRIEQEEPISAVLSIAELPISVLDPLEVQVKQYADGRHIGGVKLHKAHPEFEPIELIPEYNIWTQVYDGMTLNPLQEVAVNFWHWDPGSFTPYGEGRFRLEDRQYTDGLGGVSAPGRPSEELEAVSVYAPGYRVVARVFRPLAGQQVRLQMRAWPLRPAFTRYEWKGGDQLHGMAQLTGHSESHILRMNRLSSPSQLNQGMTITIPCYAASYRLEPWDTLDWIGASFGYKDAEGMAEVAGLRGAKEYDGSVDLDLPDWKYFYARENDNLDMFDEMFGLPRGSSIAVGRVYRPEPRMLLHGETVAVPMRGFADRQQKRGQVP